jgi:hypothetical protein
MHLNCEGLHVSCEDLQGNYVDLQVSNESRTLKELFQQEVNLS